MPSPSAPPSLLAERYRLERRIAQGGMAEVWLANDEALSRPVAVKILKPQLADDAVAAERFRREAVAVAGLAHPNIVSVYDTVEYEGRQAVVMQYVPGRSLREVLDQERKLGVDMTLRIGAAVAGALDAAHGAGLIHRDVKPGNILITPDGRVLLTDFGIAKATADADDLTSENVMMGTAKYLSPEQVRGTKLDGRADLYSLGLVLYECLAGRVPFAGSSDVDTALARLQRDPTPLGRLRPTLPAGLTALVHRLLAVRPGDRPATGAQVREAIDRVRSAVDHPARRTDPGIGRNRPDTTDRAARTGRRPAVEREPTPPSGLVVRGRPNRRLDQRWGPSLLVIGGLLLAAAVAGLFLWVAVVTDDPTSITPGSEPTPTDAPAGVDGEAAAPPVSDGRGAGDNAPTLELPGLRVSSVASFDPRGDGEENDSRLRFAVDGDTATAWYTECYQNRYFGAKQGVGVVLRLSGPARGDLQLFMARAPWNVDVYTAAEPGADLADWGDPVARDAAQTRLDATFPLDVDHRYVLLMLREAGRDESCSSANPFRAGIVEASIG